jgi:SAM-dependent methyltransferase
MSQPNAAQATYWNDQAGPTWAQVQVQLDRQLAPLGRRAMASLDPRPGERILDIGCGAGQTSLELAEAVGAGGSVLGVDISATLLEVARRRAADVPALSFKEGDAQVFPFEAGSFDAAFSRFGVMFFADPAAAFANIRKGLKPGGRLAFVCWRTPPENPMMVLPMQAVAEVLPPQSPSDPTAPGPFAFANPDRTRGLLTEAGFADVEAEPFDTEVSMGDLEAALALSTRMGALGGVLRENPHLREAALPLVRKALAAHDGPEGVQLKAAVWIVTARTPG